MPAIAIPIVTMTGVYAILGVCSDELYAAYLKEGHQIFEHSVSASYFKKYLREKEANFIEVEESKLALIKNSKEVLIWKEAIVIAIEDVKSVLTLFNFSYPEFIDSYAEYLKTGTLK